MSGGLFQNIPPVANRLLIKLFFHRICCFANDPNVLGTPTLTLMLFEYSTFHFMGRLENSESGSNDFFIVSISSSPVCRIGMCSYRFPSVEPSRCERSPKICAVILLSVQNLKSIPKNLSFAHSWIKSWIATLL